MATTFNIPQVTLPVGQRTFGPSTAADAEASITLTIDRTVAGGLNSLTTASILGADVQQSNDGGTTWIDLGGWTAEGGTIVNAHGVTSTISAGTWQLRPGTGRQLRATVTVTATSIAVAGTIVTA